MITIKIFGNGLGESILIKLPDNNYGVIDCYSNKLNDLESNPICRYLKNNKICNLKFVCWTHPHDDHSRGLPYLIENFDIEYFWRFNNQCLHEFFAYILLKDDEYKSSDNPSYLPLTKSEKYKIDIFEKIYGEKNKRNGKVYEGKIYEINLGTSLLPYEYKTRYNLTIKGLSPHDSIARKFALKQSQFIHSGILENLTEGNKHLNYNDISGALLIEYGESKIILGADTENKNWNKIIKDDRLDIEKSIDFIKVPHHGSINGYHKKLWKVWSKQSENDKKTIAIITALPNKNLPNKNVRNKIEKLSDCIILGKKFQTTTREVQNLFDHIDLNKKKAPNKDYNNLENQLNRIGKIIEQCFQSIEYDIDNLGNIFLKDYQVEHSDCST